MKIIPAPLIVVVLGVLISSLLAGISSHISLKQTQLVSIPLNVFANISFPDFSKLFSNSGIWKDGIIIGLLATLETLLCIEASISWTDATALPLLTGNSLHRALGI